jgi:ABC-type transport system involved in Fe-S cluster assembly fused permease/ATPase subunit
MQQNVSKLRSKFAVEVRNVVFSYKKNLKILNNISVQIPEGMFIFKIYFLFITQY